MKSYYENHFPHLNQKAYIFLKLSVFIVKTRVRGSKLRTAFKTVRGSWHLSLSSRCTLPFYIRNFYIRIFRFKGWSWVVFEKKMCRIQYSFPTSVSKSFQSRPLHQFSNWIPKHRREVVCTTNIWYSFFVIFCKGSWWVLVGDQLWLHKSIQSTRTARRGRWLSYFSNYEGTIETN